MHHHLEILMPPIEHFRSGVATILEPLSENSSSEGFWDWYVIGGRFAGEKLTASLDKEKIKKFWEDIGAMNLTVSGLIAGKQKLEPASQCEQVDELWRYYFPNETERCPFFSHSNDQYDSNDLIKGDVMLFSEVPRDLKMSTMIIAGQNKNSEFCSELKADSLFRNSLWNGVNWQDTGWNGTFGQALELHQERLGRYKDEYKELYTPKDDWLCITVDYHN